MAQRGDQLDRGRLRCSICLDLLNDPVNISCGHNFCKKCIKKQWNKEDQKEFICPRCAKTFTPRPALVKNTTSADLVEDLKKTGLKAAPADHCYAGPDDVACDVCTERKLKAVKFCLQCLVSYCEQHLQPHYKSPAFGKHKLVETSAKLQNICTQHNEVTKIFCRTDRQCICYHCTFDAHKGHDYVVAETEMAEKQGQIGPCRQKIHQIIQGREKQLKRLQEELEAINQSADKAVSHNEKTSTELVHLIERRRSHVKQKIRSLQKTEVSRVKNLQKKLKQEITELRSRDAQMEELARTDDQAQFLKEYFSMPPPIKLTVLPKTNVLPVRYFEEVAKAASDARGKLLHSCIKEYKKVSQTVTEVNVLFPQDPKTRAEFSHYAVCKNQLKLDPNTTNTRMVLSNDNKKVTSVKEEQSYSSHSDRFIDKPQVLSKKRLTGRCYWEVQWSGLGVSVAVAYKDIARTGEESAFGNDENSWVLECTSKGTYNIRHDNYKTSIPGPQSSRIGVFLDHSAGILSFYSVSETIRLIHRVRTTFTQPLYAGFGVCYFGSAAEICDVK